MNDDLAVLDATAQAALIRSRALQPIELVDAAIARIERVNPQLNAVITPLFDAARAAARARDLPDGPFRGVPTLLKDLGAHSAGDPFHAGMCFLRALRWVAADESYIVAKLRAAGFVILGKTNTPELGLLPTTEPAAYGATHNPWQPDHSPGGSSGGAAAAVAAGLVPAAHATDGGGSIRIPASHCGLIGLKPSRGRVSLGPDVGERWGGCAVENSVTRSVRDAAALLDVLAGAMPGDPYTAPPPTRPFVDEVGAPVGRLRIGVLTRSPGGLPVHPDCVAAAENSARLLHSLGHHVDYAHPAALEDPELMQAFATIIGCSVARALDAWSAKTAQTIGATDVEAGTWAVNELARQLPATEYLRAVETAHAHARRIAQWWADGFELLLTPTAAEPPPRLGSFATPAGNPLAGVLRAAPFTTFTAPFNITGQPAISLPLHWSAEHLPIGTHLVAAYGREDLLIRVAAQLEAAQPWAQRRPAIHA